VIHTQNTIFPQVAETLAFLLTASVFFVQPAASQRSNAAAEYLIIEHNDQLLIYNKYQQRITQQEKKAFVPFVPLRVLESHSVLNDNYTPCMKVELDGSIFYLVKNDRTTLIGAGKLGLNKIHGNVTPLQDTVQIMTERNAVLISPDNVQRAALRKGEKLIRYFQDGDLTYVRPLIAPLRFGWARLDGMIRAIPPQGKERDNYTNTVIPDKTLGRIKMKFKEVNTLLANIFMYFNKQSYQKKAVPQWHSVESKRSVSYVLEPELYGSYFPESDRYLTRDLDNILLGTIYTISYTPGKIEIHQK
jgi:hypothetical protein